MPYPYESAAKRGEPMPAGLTWAEQGHYQAIAALTARYMAGAISAEQSVKEKRMIDKEAFEAMSREKYIKWTADLYIDVEFTSISTRKALNLVPEEKRTEAEKAAQKLLDVIYGFLRFTKEEQAQHKKFLEEMLNETDAAKEN